MCHSLNLICRTRVPFSPILPSTTSDLALSLEAHGMSHYEPVDEEGVGYEPVT